MDGETGLHQPAGTDRSAGAAALHRAGPLVAPGRGHPVAAQRPGVLRAAVRYRAVAAAGADELGGLSQRRLGGDPVPVAEPVSYTHLRAHETRHDLVCRLLLEKKNKAFNLI